MQNKPENQVYAGFFVRLAAYLLDCLIVGAALLVIRIPIWISSIANPDNIIVRDFIFQYSVADIIIYVLTALYFILLTYKTGATIGKKVMHLRVISVEERKITLFEVIFRETVGRFLSALIMNVGYFIIGVSEEKRSLHDMLSDTKVIYYHEEVVYVKTPVNYVEIGAQTYGTASASTYISTNAPTSHVVAEEETAEENTIPDAVEEKEEIHIAATESEDI